MTQCLVYWPKNSAVRSWMLVVSHVVSWPRSVAEDAGLVVVELAPRLQFLSEELMTLRFSPEQMLGRGSARLSPALCLFSGTTYLAPCVMMSQYCQHCFVDCC